MADDDCFLWITCVRLSTAGKEESENKHIVDDDYLFLGELLHVDYLSKDDAYFLGTSAIM